MLKSSGVRQEGMSLDGKAGSAGDEEAADPEQGLPARRRLQGEITWRIVEHAVMRAFAVDVTEINGGSRGVARAAHARQVAMYLAHITCQQSYTQIGRMANRDRTTVAHACAVVEDERDDPLFDEALCHLERSIALMAGRGSYPNDN